ncbi:MAG: Nif3-like dinuclear metal center hexameric protein, partial [Bacteroidota bacterium]
RMTKATKSDAERLIIQPSNSEMKIQEIIAHLDAVAPPSYQESYDNAGLLTGDPAAEATAALLCLDATEDVIEEAIALGCNLVIAHHPIIFRGLKRLTGSNYVERTVIKAIRHDIAIFAIHTNLDNVFRKGVNSKIAERLGLKNTRILAPKQANQDPAIGAGMIGELPEAMAEDDFLQHVKTALQTACIRHTRLLEKPVRTVAVCGGAGSFLLPNAISQRADAFVTGDFKYHEFFDADRRILVADVGHFESEQFTMQLLQEIIEEKFSTFATHLTKVVTNPVFYC